MTGPEADQQYGEVLRFIEPPRDITLSRWANGVAIPIVTFHEDGRVEPGPGYTATEAAKEFWASLDVCAEPMRRENERLRKVLSTASELLFEARGSTFRSRMCGGDSPGSLYQRVGDFLKETA